MNEIWRRVRPYLSATFRFFHISYLEAQSDYMNTKIGILWIPFSTLIFAGILGMVFHSGGSHSPVHFFLYVLSGYACWNFISDTVSSSVDIIQKKLDFAVHSNLSLAGLFGKLLCDRLLEYGLNLCLLVAAVVVLRPTGLGWPLLLFPLLVAMLAATSLAVSYLVNLLTVFFPDLANLVKTGIRFMFFATPVFWTSSNSNDFRVLLEHYNPASYYLKMSRQAFGIEPMWAPSWAAGLGITLLVCLAGLIAYQRSHRLVRNIK